MKKISMSDKRFKTRELLTLLLLCFLLLLPLPAIAADKLVVKDAGGLNAVFRVDDSGTIEVPNGFVFNNESKAFGFGTTNPIEIFHLVKNASSGSYLRMDSINGAPGLQTFRANGSILTPTPPNSNDWLGLWTMRGFNGTTWISSARAYIGARAAEDWDETNNGTYFVFATTPLGATAAAERIRIDSRGFLGIGTTAPTHLIQLSGGAYSNGSVWTDASSREYKENIQELSSAEAAETLAKLDPVKYNYKTDAGERHVGFIAEDVPELVATKDRKGLSPMDIVAVLTKVVQEQRQTIDALQEKLNKIENQVNRLSSMNVIGRLTTE